MQFVFYPVLIRMLRQQWDNKKFYSTRYVYCIVADVVAIATRFL